MIKSNPFADVAVVIPAYNPDGTLLDLVADLRDAGCENVVVINDGSGPDSRDVFRALSKFDIVTIREHAANQGKGAALKTGFRWVQSGPERPKGVITADADGQHLPSDIRALAAEAGLDPRSMLLGCRTFGKETPFRSLFGNRLTAFLMSFVHGIRISDTQTGLRYLPLSVLPELVALSGDGYEFELQCLIKAKELGYELRQVPISTVYIDNNASSHFLPIVDSYRIYSVLFRFGGSSILCFGLDIAVFAIVYAWGGGPMRSTVAARCFSGAVNFLINKILVFRRRHTGHAVREALGYFVLWLVLMVASGSVVSLVADGPLVAVVSIKILVDISLFLLSYYVQSRYVFAANRVT